MPEREREDPPHDAVALPATFGKYFLTEKLATGGMAEIYLAKLVGPGGFEKSLVIKQIHPRLSGQRHFVDLFVAEAKTLVTLAHGNIVPVYELGVIDDTYFIAMEYIDGPTLYRLTETLRRRSVHMAPAIAAWITARILEGLAYAHRKGEGVIHRDLSPRNVMLSRDGEVKLVDFGIAVTLGDAGEDDAGQSAPTGSFPYMSPEQVRKEPLTGQTDLFSVGVLCWEMLVGSRLFARPDPDATLHAVVDGDIPRPSAKNPDVPARLDDVVMRALERDMTARWATADDMLAALQRYLYGLDETPGPRDVAALVARYCPPETRRFPTHHDVGDPDLPHDVTQPRSPAPRAPTSGEPGEPPRPGPMTAVIPRDGSQLRGKRAPRARTETFATHVALDELLERAAPAAPDGDSDAAPPDDRSGLADLGARADATSVRPRSSDAREAAAASPPHSQAPPVQLPGRAPPTAGLLVFAGLGAIGLGAAAVYVFYQGRAAVERPDAPPRRDARFDLREPDAVAAPDTLTAGAAAVAPPPDTGAQLPLDAGGFVPQVTALDAHPAASHHDAGARAPHPDARESGDRPPPADAARPAGTATLTIGANPWGDVVLDGKTIGHTPIEKLSVAAGHHVVKVTFGGEDPPRTLSYTLDLASGDTRDVLADFTRP
jgi:eukaryotic-like serine/threonine-protein kinase